MVVFGIDPGYAIVGWGAINFQSNTYKTLGYGAIETVAGTDFNKRLEYIYDETYAILNRCRPDACNRKTLLSDQSENGYQCCSGKGSNPACGTKT